MTNRYENANTKGSWRLIVALMVAIALWGGYHAVGAGLSYAQKRQLFGVSAWWGNPTSTSQPEPNRNTARDTADLRRSLVVATASFTFLAFWGAMLYARQRRLARL